MIQCKATIQDADASGRWNCQSRGACGGHVLPPNSRAVGEWSAPLVTNGMVRHG